MPSTIERLSPTRVKLTIEIPFEELKPHLDKTYKAVAEQVNIPGFRKGKVPPAVIDQRFGRGVVLQEAINEAIPEAYQDALREHEVSPLGQPEIDVTALEDKERVEFTAEVDIRPDFDLPEFSDIDVTVDAASDIDEQVEQDIETLRARFATVTEVDRAAQDGDQVMINLRATKDGKELPDGAADDVPFVLGGDQTMLDGLEEAVRGLKAGESATFTSKLLGGASRGEEADVEVTVKTVSERELPEVDDDFAQLISEFDTVEEMREDLKNAVVARSRNLQIADARDKVLEAALEKVEFELPEAVLQAELEARREQIENQLAGAGLTVESYLEESEEEEAETPEEFWNAINQRAEQALRAQILLDAYSDKNKVDVSQQELMELIFRKAQENRTSPQQEMDHMMEHGHMGEWMQEVRRGKSLVEICSQATVKDSDGNVIEMPKPPAPEADEADEASPSDIASQSLAPMEDTVDETPESDEEAKG